MIVILLLVAIIALGLTWFFVLKKDGYHSDWVKEGECPECSDTEATVKFVRQYNSPEWYGSEAEDSTELTKIEKCQIRPCSAYGRFIRIEQPNTSKSFSQAPVINLGWIKVYTKDSEGNDVLISKDKPIQVSSILRKEVKNFGPKFLHIYEQIPKDENHWGGMFHNDSSLDKKNKVTPFIEIDLEKEYLISKIEVGNRFYNYGHDRIHNADLFILREDKTPDWKGKFEGAKKVYNFEGMQMQPKN